MQGILTEKQNELLTREQTALRELQGTLIRCEAGRDDLITLEQSIRQLDELFLLVVVGEFNAGKSTFINALLGSSVLEEGVTPTTTRIHRLRYGAPETRGMVAHSRALFLSDFLGDLAPVERALTRAADKGVKGALLQILDPQEEAFPFDGRTIFESVGGTLSHETRKARDLRDRYLDRLAERKHALQSLARITGWQYHCHHTDKTATSALLWLYQALERVH